MTEKIQCKCQTCSCDDLTWNVSGICTPCENRIHWGEVINEIATQ